MILPFVFDHGVAVKIKNIVNLKWGKNINIVINERHSNKNVAYHHRLVCHLNI